MMRSRGHVSGRGASIALLAASLVLISCSATRTPFARAAGDAGSTLSAAAETMRLAHEDRLTREYAQGSFVNYGDRLAGVAADLPSLDGAPDPAAVMRLIYVLLPATTVVAAPCLEGPCDWRSQLKVLEDARDAFVEAAG
jgi:hypothetical protein